MGTQWSRVKLVFLIQRALNKCPLQDGKMGLSFKTPQEQKEQ